MSRNVTITMNATIRVRIYYFQLKDKLIRLNIKGTVFGRVPRMGNKNLTRENVAKTNM